MTLLKRNTRDVLIISSLEHKIQKMQQNTDEMLKHINMMLILINRIEASTNNAKDIDKMRDILHDIKSVIKFPDTEEEYNNLIKEEK
jgi:DNA mismatch repair ATPase MutS